MNEKNNEKERYYAPETIEVSLLTYCQILEGSTLENPEDGGDWNWED